MAKHFLQIADYSSEQLKDMLHVAQELKALYRDGGREVCLACKTMAMVFEKPSSRTRLSFQVAMTQLGGASIYLKPDDIGGLGKREPIKDFARVLNGYVDVVVARTFSHDIVVELASYATMPVINALTDEVHPCQAMADVMTIAEHCGGIEGLRVVYVGDGNNVAASLAMVSKKLGIDFVIATPKGYELPKQVVLAVEQAQGPGSIICMTDPVDAVKDADVIYTDTWISMGMEAQKAQRIKDFADYQVNAKLLSYAGDNVKIMHCLPAYRDLEITDEVIESDASVVFDQAENRLHFQRGLLKYLLCR